MRAMVHDARGSRADTFDAIIQTYYETTQIFLTVLLSQFKIIVRNLSRITTKTQIIVNSDDSITRILPK